MAAARSMGDLRGAYYSLRCCVLSVRFFACRSCLRTRPYPACLPSLKGSLLCPIVLATYVRRSKHGGNTRPIIANGGSPLVVTLDDTGTGRYRTYRTFTTVDLTHR